MKPWLFNISRNWFIELRFFEWTSTVSRIHQLLTELIDNAFPNVAENSISDTWFINMAQTSYVKIEKYLRESLSKIDPRHLEAGGLEENILDTLLTSNYLSNEDEQTKPIHKDGGAFSMQTQACDDEYVQLEDLLRQYGDHER